MKPTAPSREKIRVFATAPCCGLSSFSLDAMPHVFDITVEASLKESDLISRLLRFKEDLHRECIRERYVTVSSGAAVDNALASVSFTVRSKRDLGRFTKLMKKSLEHHDVGQAVHISKH